MKFKQHIPNIIFDPRTDTKFEIEFETKEELLSNEFVEKFSKNKNFHRYSLSHPMPLEKSYTLMQESDNGYSWWVIGFVYEPTSNFIESFPKWESKERGA